MKVIDIERYCDVAHDAALSAGIEAVFFASSNTKSFASGVERAGFRERWLGRYLTHDPEHFYIARDNRQRCGLSRGLPRRSGAHAALF